MNYKIKTELHGIFCDILGIDADFSDDTFFLELGGQSVQMGELQGRLNETYGTFIPFDKLFEYGTVNSLSNLIEEYHRNIVTGGNDVDFSLSSGQQPAEYPMTDLQIAYYVGRNVNTELGGNPTRGYSEIICRNYNHERMLDAINKLFSMHDILRTVFTGSGTQVTADTFEYKDFPFNDISDFSQEQQKEFLNKKRNELFKKFFDIFKLPLVHFEATKCSSDKVILHFSHDGMIIDGWSHETLICFLDYYYSDPNGKYDAPKIHFSDYVRYLEQMKNTEKFLKDKEYWIQKVRYGFQNPEMPLKCEPSSIHNAVTRQVLRHVSGKVWKAVRNFASEHKLTTFSIIMTAYGMAFSKYCTNDKFLLNMPVSVRPNIHEDIRNLIGECSNFFFFLFDSTGGRSLLQITKENQKQVTEIMEHNYFMGTDCVRELQKTAGASITAPMVFTSIIDIPDRPKNYLERVYTKTHTSQVWIDAISMREGDGITLIMDCVEQLFDESVTDGIGDTFVQLLEKIYSDADYWKKLYQPELTLKEKQIIEPCISADIKAQLPSLAELFHNTCSEYGDLPAIISRERTFTHSQAFSYAKAVVKQVGKLIGENSNMTVAVFLEKSVWQPVSALSCVMGRCAYYPVDLDFPDEQIAYCLKNADVKIILTQQKFVSRLKGLTDCCILTVDSLDATHENDFYFEPMKPTDIAYIINTSGTTGVPKSMRLKQEGVVNCLLETVKYCRLDSNDRFLALTKNCHDMSVFDMLIPFVCGGAVVIPDFNYEKDPNHWLELINNYKITFWNSVPAFMEIFISGILHEDGLTFPTVKNILLGGDRIDPVNVKRARKLFPNAVISSCGGPSETTIWNIFHEITEYDTEQAYIPYGKPIAHTNYYILDKNRQICPPYKRGVMYVEGIGVAEGYIGLDAETKERFSFIGNKRLYNTGDCGYYTKDGEIIILGRVDRQVKINGKRIELDGINRIMSDLSDIESSIVIVDSERKVLTAFYTSEIQLDERQLTAELKKKLPAYMIPVRFIKLNEMPITKNGKVNIKALEQMVHFHNKTAVSEKETAQSDLSMELLELCREILGREDITEQDTFFEMGGSSVSAIHLLDAIRKKYGVELTIYDIFDTPQIGKWVNLIAEN